MRYARRLALVFCGLVPLVACGGTPFDDYWIHAVELRSAPRLEFLRARAGMKFLEVRFEFENGSGEPLTLRALDFALRDGNGRLYPFSAQVLLMGQPHGVSEVMLEPGQRVPGSVVFQIPQHAGPAELIYRHDVEGGLAVPL